MVHIRGQQHTCPVCAIGRFATIQISGIFTDIRQSEAGRIVSQHKQIWRDTASESATGF